MDLALGDLLGAQLTRISTLIHAAYLAKQQPVLLKEQYHIGQGVKIDNYFEIRETICHISRSPQIALLINIAIRRMLIPMSGRTGFSKIINRIFEIYDGFVLVIFKYIYRDFLDVPLSCITSTDTGYDHSSPCNLKGAYSFRELHPLRPWLFQYLRPRQIILEQAKKCYLGYVHNFKDPTLPVVCLHVRLGDYLYKSSLTLNAEYYSQALKMFSPSECNLLIFSDEPERSSRLLPLASFDHQFVHDTNPGISMFAMSMCDSFIIANSQFSSWAAMLAESPSRVVCPESYVSSNAKESSMNGVWFPESWTPVKVGE